MKFDKNTKRILTIVIALVLLSQVIVGLIWPGKGLFGLPQANAELASSTGGSSLEVPGTSSSAEPESSSTPGTTTTADQGPDIPVIGPSSQTPTTTLPVITPPTVPPTTTTYIPPTTTVTPTTMRPTTSPTTMTEPSGPQVPRLWFTKEDMQYTSVYNFTSPAITFSNNLRQQLLEKKLKLDLAGDEPTVLIYHSHATECFTKGPGEVFDCHAAYRTTNTDYNMVSVGDALAAQLEAAGIKVIHDRTLHDYMNYSGAYDSSRKSVESYLQQYPSIKLVLDLHRDAVENADGSQYAPIVTVDGQRTAQLMLVMGTNTSDTHPNWKENVALALKTQVLMEKQVPGVTRGIFLRNSKYNQDLSVGAMLVEFGAAGNTHAEVMRAVPVLAQAIIAMMNGANY